MARRVELRMRVLLDLCDSVEASALPSAAEGVTDEGATDGGATDGASGGGVGGKKGLLRKVRAQLLQGAGGLGDDDGFGALVQAILDVRHAEELLGACDAADEEEIEGGEEEGSDEDAYEPLAPAPAEIAGFKTVD